MADLAEIGFRVNTADLEKGTAGLKKMAQAAAGVTTASERMSGTIQAANAAVASSTVAAAQAELVRSEAILKRIRNGQSSTAADKAAAVQARDNAKQALNYAKAEEVKASALLKAAAAQKVATAADRLAFAAGARISTSGAARRSPTLAVNNGPSLPNDMAPNRFNTANVAAQFQDIGVTAAMGMNPMLIALQQGTQLSAILNSMKNPLAGLAQAFGSVFNAVSLGTIALVALAAAGIQMIDWVSLAKNGLNALADALVTITPYVLGLVAVMAIFYSGAIVTGIYAIVTGIYAMAGAAISAGIAMAGAWLIALSPLQLIVLAIVAVAAAFVATGSTIAGIFRNVVGTLVGAAKVVMNIWGSLPAAIGDLSIRAANVVLKKIEEMVNGTVEMINRLVRATGGTEIQFKADLQIKNNYEGAAAAAGKSAGELFDKGFKEGSSAVDKTISAAEAMAKNAAKSIKEFASGIGQDDKKNKGSKTDGEKYEDVINGAKRKIETLKAEQAALGQTAEQAAILKYQTDLLNDANQKGLILTSKQTEELLRYGRQMGQMESATKRHAAALEFAKDAGRGFFNDMKQGLQEGKSLWESFGNAVTNVLNKIFEKLLETGVNSLTDNLFSGSGGSGILSSIGDFLFSAKGNAFDQGGMASFAKGGSFTNSIVSKPTMFQFASGGALGQMGEAGPEAIMPLHRGPDGSLGVKTSGANGGASVVVNIINNTDSKVTTQSRQGSGGLELDVMVDQMVSQKISEQSSNTNRSLEARDSRRLIQR